MSRHRRVSLILFTLLGLLGLGACVLDLTDPFLVGDGPATLSVNLSLSETTGGEGCWSARILARPQHRDGRLIPIADSTVRIDGAPLLPSRRAHELAVFVYEQPRTCGPRRETLSIEIPYLNEVRQLEWPLERLPLPWGNAVDTVRVAPGGTGKLSVPRVLLSDQLGGRARLDWSARVLRATDAPAGQEDHQLLTNFSQTAKDFLPVGAPFTGVPGSRWEIQWAIFSRVDRSLPSGELDASIQFGVSRSSFLLVDSEEAPGGMP